MRRLNEDQYLKQELLRLGCNVQVRTCPDIGYWVMDASCAPQLQENWECYERLALRLVESRGIERGVYWEPSTPVEIEKEYKEQSNTFGIWSLVTGIIGLFSPWVWPLVFFSIAAIVLGNRQSERRRTSYSIVGSVLGFTMIIVVPIILFL